jgi:hypothetical protein
MIHDLLVGGISDVREELKGHSFRDSLVQSEPEALVVVPVVVMSVGIIVVIDIKVGAVDVSVDLFVIYFRGIIDSRPTVLPGDPGRGERSEEKEKNENSKTTEYGNLFI